MQLRFSVLARDRRFSKAMRGVRGKLQPLLDAFEETELELTEDVFAILHRAMRLCPFATPDHDTFEALFDRLRPTVLS